jgi:hypothetical protein
MKLIMTFLSLFLLVQAGTTMAKEETIKTSCSNDMIAMSYIRDVEKVSNHKIVFSSEEMTSNKLDCSPSMWSPIFFSCDTKPVCTRFKIKIKTKEDEKFSFNGKDVVFYRHFECESFLRELSSIMINSKKFTLADAECVHEQDKVILKTTFMQ